MNSRAHRILAAGVVIGIVAHAHAATFCANSQSEIQTALSTAASNGEADDIRIQAGTYTMTGVSPVYTGVALALESAQADAVTLSGGWNATCSRRSAGGNTELNGDSKYPILYMESSQAMPFTVTDLVFADAGYSAVAGTVDGAALNIQTKGNVVIERDQFVGNKSNHSGAVFAASGSSSASLTLRNTLFIANQGVYVGGAYLNFAGGGTMAGNTFVANSASSATGTGGAFLHSASGSFLVANNLFYAGVGAADLELATSSVAPDTLMNNDIDVLGGGLESPASACNFSVDPGFASGLLNMHLAPDSPLVNAGYDAGVDVLGPFDLADQPRVSGAHADIGAFETDVIFHDGLEMRPDFCAVID